MNQPAHQTASLKHIMRGKKASVFCWLDFQRKPVGTSQANPKHNANTDTAGGLPFLPPEARPGAQEVHHAQPPPLHLSFSTRTHCPSRVKQATLGQENGLPLDIPLKFTTPFIHQGGQAEGAFFPPENQENPQRRTEASACD